MNPQVAAGGTGVLPQQSQINLPQEGSVFTDSNNGNYFPTAYTVKDGKIQQLTQQSYQARTALRLADGTTVKAGDMVPAGQTGDVTAIYDGSDPRYRPEVTGQTNTNFSGAYFTPSWSTPGYTNDQIKALPGFNIADITAYAQRNGGSLPNTPSATLNATQGNQPNAQDIAASTAAQTQQLAGDQGMNVTQTTTPEGVAAVQKTPLGTTPAQTPTQGAPGQPPVQTGAGAGAIPMGNGTPGGYVATPSQPAPSILDSLKMDLINGSNSLTQMQLAQEIGQKYTAQYESLKDTSAPVTGGEARSAIGGAESQKSQTSITQDFMQGYGAMNSAEKQQYDTITTALSAPVTQQSLEDKYAQEFADTNLAAGKPGESLSQEQMKMMDINNLMKGNEDAIRAEITKAGGFATEQQVQALTSARNKVLLQQASDLQTSMNAKQDYIDHLMNFTEKDRAQVEAEVDRKLGLEQMQVGLIDKMNNAAQDNYNNIIKTNGFQGLYTALQGNPAAIQTAESALGLPSGALQREAALETQAAADAAAAKNKANLQFVSGTANQSAGVFDPSTGTFTRTGGSSSGTGGTGTGGGSASSPVLNQVINTIKGSLANPTKAQLTQIDAIASSSNPLAAIRNQAQNIMGQTAATRLFSQETAQGSLDSLGEQLKQFYANGGKTDLLSGTLVEVANKLGEVKDPKLVELATEIKTTVQAYRNAISGTAFSEQEGWEIDSIFPGIRKTEGLNTAILSGRKKIMDSLVASSYNQVLGDGVYEQLQQSYSPAAKSGISNFGSGASTGNIDFGALNQTTLMQVGNQVYAKGADGTYSLVK